MTPQDAIAQTLSATASGTFLGRIWRKGVGPSIVALRKGRVIDVTSKALATSRDVCESDRPASALGDARGEDMGSLEDWLRRSIEGDEERLLSPIDLQVIKAAGVTFAASMLERVIEEKARGDASQAERIRNDVHRLIGDDLSKLVPGSPEAMELKRALIAANAWSQYLEVGIGPDAEIFTKAPILASVGFGAEIGIHPMSSWNNPEPECVLVVNSRGAIVGATLGNDVNLRDVEGRSGLLLGKAKDNNASAALGPFIRLFDDTYGIDDVNRMDVALEVDGPDGFQLRGGSTMSKISRTPLKLAAAALNEHHQYPDGFVLYCGTVFAPTQDRDAKGHGFTHKHGDVVSVANAKIGALINTVRATHQCAPWVFGVADLMRNLAGRGVV